MSSREPVLDEETRAYLAQLAAEAPPLSQHQKDVIAGAFRATVERQES